MDITVKYERKNFFGAMEYTEDTKRAATTEDLKKAFTALKKNRELAIQIDDRYTMAWDSITDYNNEVLTVRFFTSWNAYDESKRAFTAAKKDIMKAYADN